MNTYVKMIVFVLIMGTITSIILLGMDYWTEPYIKANEEFKLKDAVLRAYGISVDGDINEVFDTHVDTITREGLTFYQDKETRAISYQFEGNGVWGPIIGILTLSEDFETILAISILQQEETPGLGGRITEQPFLDSFKDILMEVVITKTPTGDSSHEVDAIVGATNTSMRLEQLLNNEYNLYRAAWLNGAEGGE